ncbi:MAG: DUF951 domain-containing protein [Chloroflexi bacterium]|nr:DUF951 domain-containing protein [Chloroflexota bacterium]
MALELKLGDVVRLKKAHPCGNHLWQVTRLGADIGLTCEKCRRHVMIPRSKLGRRVKEILPPSHSA